MAIFSGRKPQFFRIRTVFFHSFAFKIPNQMTLNNNLGTQCTNERHHDEINSFGRKV